MANYILEILENGADCGYFETIDTCQRLQVHIGRRKHKPIMIKQWCKMRIIEVDWRSFIVL